MKIILGGLFLVMVSLEGRGLPSLEAVKQQVCSVCLKPGSALRLVFIEGVFQLICAACLQKKGGEQRQNVSDQLKLPWKQTLAQTSFEECAAAFEYRQLWKKEVEESIAREFSLGAYRFVVPGGVAAAILMTNGQGKSYRLWLPKKERAYLQISTIEPLDDSNALFITQDGCLYKFSMDTRKVIKVEGEGFKQVVRQLAKNQSGDELLKRDTHKVLSDYM